MRTGILGRLVADLLKILKRDGRRVRRGDHLPSHRYSRNTSTRRTAPTEHPLNAGRKRQTSQKSRVEERLLVLQPGIRAMPLRWVSQLQDTGPQETSQLHVIPNGKNLSEISISTSKPSITQ